MSTTDFPYIEISADPDVEGFEITGIDGTDTLYQLIDDAGGSLWFMIVPSEDPKVVPPRTWICRNSKAMLAGPCTPDSGGKPNTLHANCGWGST